MRVLLSVATMLLAGCAVVRSSIDQNLAAVPDGKGIVVFSTGAEETSTSAAIGLRLVTRGTSAGPSSDTDIVVDGSMHSSELPDEHGQVRMMVLDDGDYCFRPTLLNPYLRLKAPLPDIGFRVKKGSVSYIGSVFMARGRVFQVRDRRQRDMALFQARNPSLDGKRVVAAQAAVVKECGAQR